ncbi:MAG TPA: energy transducer TonB [Thermoanaerobaculia bacterium]|nr:energy transducer TonB [Thermoanaerobaculia bacterium]
MTRPRLLFATALLLLTTSAFAQNWRGLLDSTAEDLQAQRYARARKTTIKLINSMMDNLNIGRAAGYTMGLTVAYRAIAEAGLGNYDEADWYRHVALAMSPQVAQLDVSQFGGAGAWFSSRERDSEGQSPMASSSGSDDPPPQSLARQDPVCTYKRMPKYPLGAVLGKVGAPVIVHVLIDSDGTVRHPVIATQALAPTLIYAATEAVRQWQFQPATIDGKACPAEFDLTVNFLTGKD